MIDEKIKAEIVKYAKIMDEKGMGNSYEGNISVKSDNLIYITPSHQRKSSLCNEMIAVVDENGKQVDGTCAPSSELIMHRAAYKSRPDAGSVIHSHAPYLMAYAICNKPIETNVSHEMLGMFKKIPVASYGRAGTDKICEDATELLKRYDCVLLANHGSLQVAKDLDTVFARLEAAEAMARVFTIAQSIGTPVDIPKCEIEYWFNFNPNLPT